MSVLWWGLVVAVPVLTGLAWVAAFIEAWQHDRKHGVGGLFL